MLSLLLAVASTVSLDPSLYQNLGLQAHKREVFSSEQAYWKNLKLSQSQAIALAQELQAEALRPTALHFPRHAQDMYLALKQKYPLPPEQKWVQVYKQARDLKSLVAALAACTEAQVKVCQADLQYRLGQREDLSGQQRFDYLKASQDLAKQLGHLVLESLSAGLERALSEDYEEAYEDWAPAFLLRESPVGYQDLIKQLALYNAWGALSDLGYLDDSEQNQLRTDLEGLLESSQPAEQKIEVMMALAKLGMQPIEDSELSEFEILRLRAEGFQTIDRAFEMRPNGEQKVRLTLLEYQMALLNMDFYRMQRAGERLGFTTIPEAYSFQLALLQAEVSYLKDHDKKWIEPLFKQIDNLHPLQQEQAYQQFFTLVKKYKLRKILSVSQVKHFIQQKSLSPTLGLEILQEIDLPSAHAQALEMMTSTQFQDRKLAVEHFLKYKVPAYLDLFYHLLKSEQESVRGNVIQVLWALEGHQLLKSMPPFLKDPSDHVRSNALQVYIFDKAEIEKNKLYIPTQTLAYLLNLKEAHQTQSKLTTYLSQHIAHYQSWFKTCSFNPQQKQNLGALKQYLSDQYPALNDCLSK